MRDRKLTAHTKLAFGVGQVAESIQLNTFDFFLFFYYVQVLHLDPILAGAATLMALMVDAVTDPAVGVFSDNCRSRLGRRHPFMYASAIPFGLLCIYLFSFYDISRKSHEATLKTLQERRRSHGSAS